MIHELNESQSSTEAALREANASLEERLRLIADNSPDVFWAVTFDPERVTYLSPAVETVFGIPAERFHEDLGAWARAIHPLDRAQTAQAFEACASGASDRLERDYRIVRPDGAVRWVSDKGTVVHDERGAPLGMSGVLRDVTELLEAEQQARRAQRLACLGQLAGGVVHDLNNALAPITLSVGLLKLKDPAELHTLELLERSAKRAADMVQQLLSFAKGAEGERVHVRPRALVSELAQLMSATFPKNIELDVDCEEALPTVLGDATQLHQALLNLCVNARDAMPRGGKLTLRASRSAVDSFPPSWPPELDPRDYVRLQVQDTGVGIPEEIIDEIFKPFFTTKGPVKGSGLGLSTAQSVVKSHGGFVLVRSPQGEGTTFAVYLPAAGAAERHAAEDDDVPAPFRGEGELILYVEDEGPLRETALVVLERLNLRVLTASDGLDALSKAARARAGLGAVVTDLSMPHMDGLAFTAALRQLLPGVPIAVASGRFEPTAVAELAALGITERLHKPFTEAQLAEVLTRLLATG